MLKRVARFLHIVDNKGQLDITDLAFICIIVKIMMSTNLDWPSVIVLATACMNKMQRRHSDAKEAPEMKKMIEEQSNQIKEIKDKVEPIIQVIKDKLS